MHGLGGVGDQENSGRGKGMKGKKFQLDVHHWSSGDVVSYSVDVRWEAGIPNRNKQPSLMVSTQDNGFQHQRGRVVSVEGSHADRSGESTRQRLKTNTTNQE